jgi:hypothetical protein
LSVPVTVQADPYKLEQRSTEILFTVRALDDDALYVTQEARFLGPEPR